MPTQLRAGHIADDWTSAATNSMAKDMEDALRTLIDLPVDDDPTPRRLFLLAIATGVIAHLKRNHGAFTMQVRTGGPLTTRSVEINA